jgi:hypothetical protein
MPASRRMTRRTGSPSEDCQSWPAPRWVAVLFLIGLLNASLFALLTPLWQAPDEPGHFEYACLLGQTRRPLVGHEHSLALQQTIIASLARHDFWRLVREPQPDPLPASFAADPFLLRSASQIGDEPPTYYLAPAALCRLPLSLETQARLMRLWGALLFGLTAAAAAWGWGRGPADRVGLPVLGRTGSPCGGGVARLHPLVVALLPMPAFIAGSINNDGLALLTATLVFAAVLRIQRLGWSWPRGLGLTALLALALASKKTNAFLAPWLALLAGAELWRWLGRRGWSRQRRLLLGGLATAGGVLVLLLPTPAPAGWRGVDQMPGGGRVQTHLPDGPGWAVRIVQGGADREGRLYQNLEGLAALAGQPVEATVWVRSADAAPASGRLLLRDTAGASQTDFEAGPQWQPVTLQRTLAITTTYARLVVFPTADLTPQEGGRLLMAKAALRPLDGATLLRNGDFSTAARLGELLAAPLADRWGQFIPRSPAAGGDVRRSLLYAGLTFAGFWGNYGWLQAPLPVALYALLAGVVAWAGLGMALRWRREAPLRPLLAAWLLACALIAAQTFLPMMGREWQPQGRYLFPALLPITGLLLLGLDHWLDLDGRPAARVGLVAALLAFMALGLAVSARVL